LDISDGSQRNSIEDYRTLNLELALFNPAMAKKTQVIAVNKMDTPEAKKKLPEVRRFFRRINQKVYPISALNGKGLPELLGALVKQLPPRWKEEKGL